jgi:hypothetical protein
MARVAGKARMESKDYVMADGDVAEFRFSKEARSVRAALHTPSMGIIGDALQNTLRTERVRQAADLVVQSRPDLAEVTRVSDMPTAMARIDLPGGQAVIAAYVEHQGVQQFMVVSPDGPDIPANTAEAMAQEMIAAYDRATSRRSV